MGLGRKAGCGQAYERRKELPGEAARRRFLLAAAAGAAAVAMPQVSLAQTAIWRIQVAWPSRDLFHEFAVDYAKKVDAMTGGRLKIRCAGGRLGGAGAFRCRMRCMAASSTAAMASPRSGTTSTRPCAVRQRRRRSAGTRTAFSPGSTSGGGEALYKELLNDILKLNLVGFLYFPMPIQPLGWFRKEIKSGDDFKGVRYRTAGLAGEVFMALGVRVGDRLPSGEIVPAWSAACLTRPIRTIPPPTSSSAFPDVAKFYMMGSHHRPAEALRDRLQQGQVRRALRRIQSDPAARGIFGVQRAALVRPTPATPRTSRRSESAASTSSRPVPMLRRAAQGLGPGDCRAVEGAVLCQGDRLAEGLGETHRPVSADQQSRRELAAAYRHFFG